MTMPPSALRGASAAALALASLLLLAAAAAPAAAQSDLAPPTDGSGADPFAAAAAAAPPGATEPDQSGARFGLAPGVGTPAGEPRLRYQGIATVAYDPEPLSPFGAVKLGCSLGFVSPTFQASYVGVSPGLFSDGMACDRCLRIQCDDVSCANPAMTALPAMVADVCGSCTQADLAISTPLFKNLTGRDPGSNPSIVVSWDITPCAPYTQGSIKMLVKQGGSAFYQAFNFANSVQPIVAVQINGQRLQHGSDNYWAWNPGQPIDPSAALNVALLGSTREVLRARVPSLRSADLGVQFKAS